MSISLLQEPALLYFDISVYTALGVLTALFLTTGS